jgi:hypothetical protein
MLIFVFSLKVVSLTSLSINLNGAHSGVLLLEAQAS